MVPPAVTTKYRSFEIPIDVDRGSDDDDMPLREMSSSKSKRVASPIRSMSRTKKISLGTQNKYRDARAEQSGGDINGASSVNVRASSWRCIPQTM